MKMTGERWFSVFLLIVCVVFLIEVRNISTFTLPGSPGARVFPLAIIGLLASLVILHEILTIRRSALAKRKETSTTMDSAENPKVKQKQDTKKLVISFIVLLFYVIGINYLGFYVSTLIVVFIILKIIFGLQSWLKTTIFTALLTGAIYVIFALLFSIRMPLGILGLL